jgi:hypothetical protein
MMASLYSTLWRKRSGMWKISIVMFLLCFTLLRPYEFVLYGLKQHNDDDDYFAHATSLAYGTWPSYQHEYLPPSRHEIPQAEIGSGIFAAPFVFAFSTVDRLQHAPIVQQRKLSNILQSWSLFGFIVSTQVYFWLACLLSYTALKYTFSERSATLTVILMLMTQGLVMSVFRRPVFSHAYELFAQCCLVYCLLMQHQASSLLCRKPKFLVAAVGIMIGLLTMTRYNCAQFAFFWPIAIFFFNKNCTLKNRLLKITSAYTIGLSVLMVFFVYPGIYHHGLFLSHGYTNILNQHLISGSITPIIILQRVAHLCFGLDHGLLFIAPFTLIALAATCFINFPHKKSFIALLLPLLIQIAVVVKWNDNGGAFYGYRLFVFSLAALCSLPFCAWLHKIEHKAYFKKILLLLVIIAIQPLISMFAFQGPTLLLNYADYKSYELNIWALLFTQPHIVLTTIFKGGFLYIAYLIAMATNTAQHLPAVILQKYNYPHFSSFTLFRTLTMYFLPFILFSIYRKTKAFRRN